VRLIFFERPSDCDTCGPVRSMLEGLAQSSEAVRLETVNVALEHRKATRYHVDRVPAVVVSASGSERMRFYGAPLGNELDAFVQAIRMASTGDSGLSQSSRARLKALSAPLRLQVFFTPSCGQCPRMVELACRLAVESPHVTMTAIDATEYPDLVRRYNVNGVPKTVVNDTVEILGAVTEEELVSAIC
jgi:glutaredoxin-like protein